MKLNTKVYLILVVLLLFCISYSLYSYSLLRKQKSSLSDIMVSIGEKQNHESLISVLNQQLERRKSWDHYKDSLNRFLCQVDIFKKNVRALNTDHVNELIDLIPIIDKSRLLTDNNFCEHLNFFSATENISDKSLYNYHYDILITDLINVWLTIFDSPTICGGSSKYVPILEDRGEIRSPLLYCTYITDNPINRYYYMIDNKVVRTTLDGIAVYPVKKNRGGLDSLSIKFIYEDHLTHQFITKDYVKYF